MAWNTNPQLSGIVDQINNTAPTDTSATDAYFRNLFRGLNKGRDVSTIQAFQPMIKAGETQQRMGEESASYGDAGLIGATGTPEQKAVLDRQNEIQRERTKEATGQSIANAVPGMVQAGTQYGAEQAGNENAFNLEKFGTKTNAINQNSQYQVSPWLQLAQGLIAGGAKAASSFI